MGHYFLDDLLHDQRVLVSFSVASAMDEALEYQTVILDLGVGLHHAQLQPSTSPLSFHMMRSLLTAVFEVPNWPFGSSSRRNWRGTVIIPLLRHGSLALLQG